jgi:electron transfer flavoprotein beta subunit
MKAKKKELLSTPVAELNPATSLLETAQMAPPEKKGGGLILEGDPAELADQLIQILKEKTTALA